MKTPWLKKNDLRKIIKKDGLVYHPDIKSNCTYLVRCDRDWYCGYFTREWYGLCFVDCSISLDLDDPDIKGIWQIRIGI